MGPPLIGGHGDSSLITCVWVRGVAGRNESFISGQMLWEQEERRWVVLPGSLPGLSRSNSSVCSSPPEEVVDLHAYPGE